MHILFPGRHHLLTDFQFKYLFSLIQSHCQGATDVDGVPIAADLSANTSIESLVFAVTSANHAGTRRNPLPFYLRALAIQEFSRALQLPTYTYGIDDVGHLDNFATYVLKKIKHDSEGRHTLTPQNTLVVCSTPVLKMYRQLGFKILPAELLDATTWQYKTKMPWQVVERIATSPAWISDPEVLQHMHPASYALWKQYSLGQKVQQLFTDPIVGEDGDITDSRDYSTYVQQMDQNAALKYSDTAAFISPGRIGDIGCAAGSWIKLACADERLHESDFYGIEVTRHLYDLCLQRKHNGAFANPNVFFAQKNAVKGLVFDRESMDTIHTSSLTHEIESYGSRAGLLKFISNRYDELKPGGIWINRDVIGPEGGEKEVLLWLNSEEGSMGDWQQLPQDALALSAQLQKLSTRELFKRFALDFRRKEGYQLPYEEVEQEGKAYVRLSLRDAAEFMLTKDYTDNWQSEMHETFCFWSLSDWKKALQEAGFKVDPRSYVWTNPWIIQNRWQGKVALFSSQGQKLTPLPFPPTNVMLLASKA